MPRATTAPRQSTPHAGRRRAGSAAAAGSRGRRRGFSPGVPLGSLTQHALQTSCYSCGSSRVTQLAMQLTDGTPVQFTSCHRCECRRWEHDGVELSVENVLDRTRKAA